MVNNDHFYVVRGWMINELNLKGNELEVYAIIYSFTQGVEKQNFTGSAQYLADWTNSTLRGVQKTIKSLQEKGLLKIIKISSKRNAYHTIRPKKNDSHYELSSQSNTNSVRNDIRTQFVMNTNSVRNEYELSSHNINNKTNKDIYKTDRLLMPGCLPEKKSNIPTLEEVKAYAKELGLLIDPVKFYEKNQERGWITKNGQPVKRWKSLMLTWNETEDIKKPVPKDKNSFMQNTYDFDALEKQLLRN